MKIHLESERYPLAFLVALFDLSLVFLSAFAAYYLQTGHFSPQLNHEVIILLTALMIISCSSFSNLYLSWHGQRLKHQLFKIISVWVFVFLCLFNLLFLSEQYEFFSRNWLVLWFVIGINLNCIYKIILFLIFKKLRQSGKNLRHVLILGQTKLTTDIVNRSIEYPEYGFKIKQMNINSADFIETEYLQKVLNTVENNTYQELWICLPFSEAANIKKLLYHLRNSTLEIRLFPSIEELSLLNYDVTHLMGFHSINLSCSSIVNLNATVKSCQDVFITCIILCIISIPCLIISILIKITSPGPVLFKQLRHGLNKKEFTIYKFRSMNVHTESKGKTTQATKNDVRITKLGAFLRKTSLDELPQFINVLQGKMSIVGPRPHALAHNEYYQYSIKSYMWRHKVKPGITGWAQINGHRGETDTLEKMQARVEHDLWYIENWSLILDLKIIFLTILKGFINKNAY